jgi:NAD(P)-dependent dehydrogenase (short-subunit alcohol dehydrogenase family)
MPWRDLNADTGSAQSDRRNLMSGRRHTQLLPPLGRGLSAKLARGTRVVVMQHPVVAITGASGALGQALLRSWHRRGARLIALSCGPRRLDLCDSEGSPIPVREITWCVGQEQELGGLLQDVDVLVLNHGINVHDDRSAAATEQSLQVNALSGLRLLELFATVVAQRPDQAGRPRAEVWINTSEAEIQPAFSPLYEISKRLIGQLLSLRSLELVSPQLRIRRLVLGPFRSGLNPVGLMGAQFVADQVLVQAQLGFNLIIVTPNPLTYLVMPLATLGRWLYFRSLTRG